MKKTVIKSKNFLIEITTLKNEGWFKQGSFFVLNEDLTGLDYWTLCRAISRTHGRRKILELRIFDKYGNDVYGDEFTPYQGEFMLNLR